MSGIGANVRRAFALSFLLLSCAPEEPSPPLPAFGDDRVAEVLSRDPSRAPRTYAEHEALFGVGRACATPSTFVIEEQGTRFAEVVVPLARVAPRVIVTGCGSTPDSYGLFTVMPTDPARDPKDPLARTPVEVMALDRTTGTYSFYVFDDEGVQRIVRDASDRVYTVVSPRDGSKPRRVDGGRRCYGCHVQGGPIMASLGDPWTSWISVRRKSPLGSYEGETAALTKGGLANDLEPIVRNGNRALARAIGARTLAGLEPGGVSRLLRSVFCETEVQWASASSTMPLSLFVDPGAAAGAELVAPPSTDGFPALLPVRSDIDQRIEEWLVEKGILELETVRVVRLLDDRNDVFSPSRCGVLEGLTVPADGVDAFLRAALGPAIARLPEPAARYARALFGDGDLAAARAAYFASVRARIDAERDDRTALEARVAARRLAARAMFPTSAHPLPIAALP